jgi:diguanylate cyclase (GGDEF)-like protein
VSVIIDRVPPSLRAALAAATVLAAFLAAIWLRERRRRRAAERAALVDPLTGALNRLALEQSLAREWNRAQRYNRPLGVLLIDVDDFKHINDRAGHAAGDRTLCEVAGLLRARMRDTDTLARFGGDEFVAVCPETEGYGLQRLATSLSDATAEAAGIPVRLSIGAAELESGDTHPLDLIARADQAMYRQKRDHGAIRDSTGALASGMPPEHVGATADRLRWGQRP